MNNNKIYSIIEWKSLTTLILSQQTLLPYSQGAHWAKDAINSMVTFGGMLS